MKWHVLKSNCDVFALHCVTKLLFACITKKVAAHVKRGQRPIDRQHFGDCLSACCTDLNVIPARFRFQIKFCESVVVLESGTDCNCTFVSDVVAAEICGFQRPVEK